MIKDDAHEILKSLVERAYADGKNGELYAEPLSCDTYAKAIVRNSIKSLRHGCWSFLKSLCDGSLK